MDLVHQYIDTPVGRLVLEADNTALIGVRWLRSASSASHAPINELSTSVQLAGAGEHPVIARTAAQLEEYFSKTRQVFDIPLNLLGSPFQQKVWQVLATIPFGKTMTYGEVAKVIGDPKSVRAVGMAANRNPVSIIIPCHRVIGASGQLVGFGGGLENKSYLLRLEASQQSLAFF